MLKRLQLGGSQGAPVIWSHGPKFDPSGLPPDVTEHATNQPRKGAEKSACG